MTMKLLIVSALLCAFLALTSAVEANTEAEGLKPSVSLPKPSVCPRGWTPYNNRCFKYFPRPMTWAIAERNCQFLEANLASVHSDLEHSAIRNMTAIISKKQVWIGGTDAPQDMYWFWSDGTPFRYSNWCSGQPSNGPSEDCLRMNSGSGCWDDVRCAIRLPSLCARKMDLE